MSFSIPEKSGQTGRISNRKLRIIFGPASHLTDVEVDSEVDDLVRDVVSLVLVWVRVAVREVELRLVVVVG